MKISSPKNGIPNYLKYFIVLGSIVLTIYVIILSKAIFNPILAALILALLLKPLSSRMERIKIPRALSSILSIFLIFIVVAGLSYFFSTQIAKITSELDSIESRFNSMVDRGHGWMESHFGIAASEQSEYIKNALQNFLENSSSFFGNTLSATAGFFAGFFLFIIAMFFFLYYRSFLVSFLYKIFSTRNHLKLTTTLGKVQGVVRSYILGLFFVIVIVAILNTTGLMLLGIKHAIFFGVLAAILTIIPYIGILIGALLPIAFALITKDSLWYPLGVLLIFWFVQFLEGNFITPNVVGNQVSINPFAAILGLFIGGLILGAIGMIFAIPLLAILKVICDGIEPVKPIGYLIGSPPDEDQLKMRRRERLGMLFKRRKSISE